MISIGKPFITETSEHAYLKAPVKIPYETALEFKNLEKKLHKAHWRFYENYPPVEWEDENSSLFFRVKKNMECIYAILDQMLLLLHSFGML